jgi:rhodanese-related sulfurtransferase
MTHSEGVPQFMDYEGLEIKFKFSGQFVTGPDANVNFCIIEIDVEFDLARSRDHAGTCNVLWGIPKADYVLVICRTPLRVANAKRGARSSGVGKEVNRRVRAIPSVDGRDDCVFDFGRRALPPTIGNEVDLDRKRTGRQFL